MSAFELEEGSKKPPHGTIEVSNPFPASQSVSENIDDTGLELHEFREARIQPDDELPASSESVVTTNMSSLPPVDKGRKAWKFVRTKNTQRDLAFYLSFQSF